MSSNKLQKISVIVGLSASVSMLSFGCGSSENQTDPESGSDSDSDSEESGSSESKKTSGKDSASETDGTAGEESSQETTGKDDETEEGSSEEDTSDDDSGEADVDSDEDSETDSDSEDTGDDIDPKDLFSDVEVSVHSEVANILVVSWNQKIETDSTWIKYTFEDDEWYTSLPKPGDSGSRKESILGIPENTEVTFKLIGKVGNKEIEDESRKSTNGKVPSRMPRPTIVSYDESLASENRWMLGGISSTGYPGPFWIYIIDRKGRIVWYYRDAEKERLMTFPRISQDYTYIGIERRDGNKNTGIHLLSLDHGFTEEIELPDMCDAFDIIDGDIIVYNTLERKNPGQDFLDGSHLNERTPDGMIREIWDCEPWAREHHGDGTFKRNWCYSNTVFWEKASDSVILSMPYYNTVLQIDRKAGNIVSEWGDLGDWKFDPSNLGFDFNHWANISKEGTLLVSSHLPGQSKAHRFMEFEIDRDNKTLKEKGMFGEGFSDFPAAKGMVERLENGNTLANYGTDGVIREFTPDNKVAWELQWRSYSEANDDVSNTRRAKQMVGHNILINDLYGINRGKSYRSIAGTSRPQASGNRSLSKK